MGLTMFDCLFDARLTGFDSDLSDRFRHGRFGDVGCFVFFCFE